MPKLVCPECQMQYIPLQNGVAVITMFLEEPQPYKVEFADLWICPVCGNRVLAGFSEGNYQHFEKDFDEHLNRALAGPHVINWEHAFDKERFGAPPYVNSPLLGDHFGEMQDYLDRKSDENDLRNGG